MSGEHVQITGVREVVKNLKALDKALIKDVKRINKEAAQTVAEDARSRAPRRSGNLASSVRAGATQYSGIVRVGSAKVPYAGPIIFGWHKHDIKPQPFIYHALDARRGEVLVAYEAALGRLVEEHFPGGI